MGMEAQAVHPAQVMGLEDAAAMPLRVRQVASGNYAADSSQMTTLSGEARRLANLFSRAVARRRQARGDRRNAGISADFELRDALWRCPDGAAAVKE